MHDGSEPAGDGVRVVPHALTPQWQSFEFRMRARRADRCIRRAQLAVESGSLADASEALDEARQLGAAGDAVQQLIGQLTTIKAAQESRLKGRANRRVAVVWMALVSVGLFGSVYGDRSPRVEPRPDDAPAVQRQIAVGASAPDHQDQSAVSTEAATPPDLQPAPEITVRTQDTIATSGRIGSPEPSAPAPARATAPPPPEVERSPIVESARRADVSAPSTDLTGRSSPPPSFAPPASPSRPSMPSPVPALTSPAPAPSPIPAVTTPPSVLTAAASADAPDGALAAATSPQNVDQRAAIRAALNRYETAYSRLDVSAVQAVWPALDSRALTRAFDGLASQRVSLGSCEVDVNAGTARANCAGTAAWIPKVGGGQRTAPRRWVFELTQSDGGWHIVRVAAR